MTDKKENQDLEDQNLKNQIDNNISSDKVANITKLIKDKSTVELARLLIMANLNEDQLLKIKKHINNVKKYISFNKDEYIREIDERRDEENILSKNAKIATNEDKEKLEEHVNTLGQGENLTTEVKQHNKLYSDHDENNRQHRENIAKCINKNEDLYDVEELNKFAKLCEVLLNNTYLQIQIILNDNQAIKESLDVADSKWKIREKTDKVSELMQDITDKFALGSYRILESKEFALYITPKIRKKA